MSSKTPTTTVPATSRPMLRTSSSSSSSRTNKLNEEDQFLRPPSLKRGRRGSSRSSTRSAHEGDYHAFARHGNAPMGPPIDPELHDTDEAWRVHHEREKQSSWHHVPLILVALPPLGAIIHGRAENWSDAIILILVCFYLYQLIKVPWDVYYSSHSRKVLDQAMNHDHEDSDPVALMKREHAAHSLRRNELISLLATFLVPAIGAYLLHYVRGLLSDPDRYINRFVISLFILATSVKPLLHFGQLVKSNSLYYQEAVHYPSTEVHFLRRRVEALEKELSQLTKAFATKDDVRTLRDGVDVPLSALNKAVRRFDRREELLRMSSEERFIVLEQKMDRQKRELENSLAEIDALRRDTLTNPVNTLLKVIHALVGGGHHHQANHRRVKGGHAHATRALRWYERGPLFYLLFPVNVGNKALEYISTKSESGDEENDDDPDGQEGDEYLSDYRDQDPISEHARKRRTAATAAAMAAFGSSPRASSGGFNSPKLLQSPSLVAQNQQRLSEPFAAGPGANHSKKSSLANNNNNLGSPPPVITTNYASRDPPSPVINDDQDDDLVPDMIGRRGAFGTRPVSRTIGSTLAY